MRNHKNIKVYALWKPENFTCMILTIVHMHAQTLV
jgi:hypothetical protein